MGCELADPFLFIPRKPLMPLSDRPCKTGAAHFRKIRRSRTVIAQNFQITQKLLADHSMPVPGSSEAPTLKRCQSHSSSFQKMLNSISGISLRK